MKQDDKFTFFDIVRSNLVIVWVIVSTSVYGFICMVIGFFYRRFAFWISTVWSKNLAFFSGVKTVVRGLEKLDRKKNYLFIANHTSFFDIIVLFNALPFMISFIARKNLFYIPLFGWAIAMTGHIPIDRGNPARARKSIDRACRLIKKDRRSIFGFPEGTRSQSGELEEFKLGLFGFAVDAGIDIVPIGIRGARDVMRKGNLVIRPGTIYLDVAEPISVEGYTARTKKELADKAWKIIYDIITDNSGSKG